MDLFWGVENWHTEGDR